MLDDCARQQDGRSMVLAYFANLGVPDRHQTKVDRSGNFLCVLRTIGYCVDDFRRWVVVQQICFEI